MILDGKKLALEIKAQLKEKLASIPGRAPALAVILVGDDPASEIYVRRKASACERIGIHSIFKKFSSDISEKHLLDEIHLLNNNPNVNGILVQLPLPRHINPLVITESIDPNKDVDGFHPYNVGKLQIGLKDGFIPCTPLGIMRLLEHYDIHLSQKHVVVIGRSNIVGKPMASLLLQNSPESVSSLTVLSRYSINVKEHCLQADIIVVAVGIQNFITADMVKEGAVVIDIGTNKVANSNKIVGDVDFDPVSKKCSYITPVPGGVGPMTIAMLLENTVMSFNKRTLIL